MTRKKELTNEEKLLIQCSEIKNMLLTMREEFKNEISLLNRKLTMFGEEKETRSQMESLDPGLDQSIEE